MSNEMDKKISDLLDILKEKKEDLKQTEKQLKDSWKTHCNYKTTAGNAAINIQTVSSENTIIEIVSDLLQKLDSHQKATQLLGLDTELKISSYLVSDWLADCKKRVAMLKHKEKKDELENTEKKLNDLVSPERRRELELAKLEKLVNNL